MPSRQKPPLENPPQSITRKYKNGQQKRFLIGRLLGKGGFARCYHLTDAADHNKVYAAKIVQKNWLTKKTEGKLESEIKIHRSLKHEGVVKLYTQFDDDQFVYIILELCTNQTLVEMLRQRKRLSEAEVRYFAIQILLTVHHLHKEGVIHRDLKLGNLFLNDKMHTKLGDFGLATKLESQDERRKTICGTPNYIAPEIITRGGHGHTFPVDVWSIGCILYTLLVGKPPFQSQNLNDTYSKIKESSYSWPADVRPSRPAVDLVRRMLLVNAEERITVEEVFRHSFFAEPLPQRLPSSSRFQDPTSQIEVYSPNHVTFYGESVRQDEGNGLLTVPKDKGKAEVTREGKENELVKHHQQQQQTSSSTRSGGLQARSQQPLQPHNPNNLNTQSSTSKRRPKTNTLSSQTASPSYHQHKEHSSSSHYSQQTPPSTPTSSSSIPASSIPASSPSSPTNSASSSGDDFDPSAVCPALPSRFFCALTNKLIQEPIQSPCGHFFNFDDAAEWLSSRHPRAQPSSSPSPQPKKPCPICTTPLSLDDFVFHPDLKLEIEQLRCSRHPKVFLLRNYSFSFSCLSHFEKPSTHTPSEVSCLCLSGFVKQYLDYSSKYGLAYELFDGKMGAYFNDQSRLVMSRCRSYLQYHPYVPRNVSESERRNRSKFIAPNCFSPEEAKKMKLINSFAGHFDNINKERERHAKQQKTSGRFRCHSGSQPQPPQLPSDPAPETPISEEEMLVHLEEEKEKHSLPHLEKYHLDNSTYVFILSNGGIQVSFKDGSAILFYKCNQTFTFLSPWKTIHTYNFASSNYVKEGQITERLGESERLLMKFGVINRG